MDYEPFDSSGTDDDLPRTNQNRNPRVGRVAGNGRRAQLYPRTYGETDMEAQIHHLEKEAYSSVLRAFKAQDDAITWEKESLITELRKELRLSNEEHRELLGKVNADDVIRRIREWRQSQIHNNTATGQLVLNPSPSPSVSASRKKHKKMNPSQSYGAPFHTQPQPPNQPSSSAARRAPLTGIKTKNKKSMKMQYPSSSSGPTPSGRGQIGNNGVKETGASFSPPPLIGRKVRTRWPDDNNFYEAVITDYNPVEGRHALVYDINTENETWEWVNLEEICLEDIQWEGEDPGIGHNRRHGINRGGIVGVGRGGRGRGRGMIKGGQTQNGIIIGDHYDIQLLHTDALIKEVERVFGSGHQDPLEIDKAKKFLKEHEQALADAIATLAHISDAAETDQPTMIMGCNGSFHYLDEGGGRWLHMD